MSEKKSLPDLKKLGQAALCNVPIIGPSAAAATLLAESLLTQNDGKKELSEKERLALVEWQVKLAKEFAIARRIDTAEKVTIEEYYETRGSGKAGGALDPAKKSAKLELSGSGERVTKRVYIFEGVRDLTDQEQAQMDDFLNRTTFAEETDPSTQPEME